MSSEEPAPGRYISNRASEMLGAAKGNMQPSGHVKAVCSVPRLTTSPSILSGSITHKSLEINPPESVTDAPQGGGWGPSASGLGPTKGGADEEKTKIKKIKRVSARSANSIWGPLENSLLFLPYRFIISVAIWD